LPHKQDSGGFFVAVLHKKCQLQRGGQDSSKSSATNPISKECTTAAVDEAVSVPTRSSTVPDVSKSEDSTAVSGDQAAVVTQNDSITALDESKSCESTNVVGDQAVVTQSDSSTVPDGSNDCPTMAVDQASTAQSQSSTTLIENTTVTTDCGTSPQLGSDNNAHPGSIYIGLTVLWKI